MPRCLICAMLAPFSLYFSIELFLFKQNEFFSVPFFVSADPEATGVAVCDIDRALLSSIRARMPIEQASGFLCGWISCADFLVISWSFPGS